MGTVSAPVIGNPSDVDTFTSFPDAHLPATMSGNDFTFIGLSGHTDLDTQATNKLVRSHVMRRYRRQQKSTSRKRKHGPQSTKEDSISDTTWSSGDVTFLAVPPCMDDCAFEISWPDLLTSFISPESLAEQDRVAGEQQSTPEGDLPSIDIRTWLDGEMDPFSSLPFQMNQHSLMLLQRSKYSKSLSFLGVDIHQQDAQLCFSPDASSPLRTSVHADPSGTYRRICSKDPAWLFMHLHYAACRFSQSSPEHNREATRYLLQSESAVSNSIRESPNAIDDSTIATVACLANIEVRIEGCDEVVLCLSY